MEKIAEWQAQEMFNDWLDDVAPLVTVLGFTLSPSAVLRETDPIAYRTTFHDYIDRCQKDGWFLVEGY
jgi:hypothetical protein